MMKELESQFGWDSSELFVESILVVSILLKNLFVFIHFFQKINELGPICFKVPIVPNDNGTLH